MIETKYPCIVEFAPFQRNCLSSKGKRVDELSNTIENDPAFVKFMSNEPEEQPEVDASVPVVENLKDTPLLQALRRKHKRKTGAGYQAPKQILTRNTETQPKPKKSSRKKKVAKEKTPGDFTIASKPPVKVQGMTLQLAGKPAATIKSQSAPKSKMRSDEI